MASQRQFVLQNLSKLPPEGRRKVLKFLRQFGETTPKGWLPVWDDAADKWVLVHWTEADTSAPGTDDFEHLPKVAQDKWRRVIDENAAKAHAKLTEGIEPLRRRSPRERTADLLETLLAGAVRHGDHYSFAKSVLLDIQRELWAVGVKVGDRLPTLEDIQTWAVRRLESDARAQGADLGWSETKLSATSAATPSPQPGSDASPPRSAPDGSTTGSSASPAAPSSAEAGTS